MSVYKFKRYVCGSDHDSLVSLYIYYVMYACFCGVCVCVGICVCLSVFLCVSVCVRACVRTQFYVKFKIYFCGSDHTPRIRIRV